MAGRLQALSLLVADAVPFCRMLYDYVERKRKENSGAQLHVTYLVAGNLLQNGHVVSVSLPAGVCGGFTPHRCLGALWSLFCLVLGSEAELALCAAGAAGARASGEGSDSGLGRSAGLGTQC